MDEHPYLCRQVVTLCVIEEEQKKRVLKTVSSFSMVCRSGVGSKKPEEGRKGEPEEGRKGEQC